MENKLVTPLKTKFYRRYVDGIFNQCKKNVDILFKRLHNYNKNIKLTIEIDPTLFLHAKLDCVNCIYKIIVHRKTTKLPIHWSPKALKRQKRNAIFGDLNRTKRISTDFDAEVTYIIDKFWKAGYPLRFINIVNDFIKSTSDLEDSYIIPAYLFEEQKPFILTEITFRYGHEKRLREFVRKFHEFTNNKFQISIK